MLLTCRGYSYVSCLKQQGSHRYECFLSVAQVDPAVVNPPDIWVGRASSREPHGNGGDSRWTRARPPAGQTRARGYVLIGAGIRDRGAPLRQFGNARSRASIRPEGSLCVMSPTRIARSLVTASGQRA